MSEIAIKIAWCVIAIFQAPYRLPYNENKGG